MSLVNQMLRDLESRRPAADDGKAMLNGLTSSAAPLPKRTLVIALLMVAALIGGGLVWYLDQKKMAAGRVQPIAAPVVSAVATAPPATPPQVEPPTAGSAPVRTTAANPEPVATTTPVPEKAPAAAGDNTEPKTPVVQQSQTPEPQPAKSKESRSYRLTDLQLTRQPDRTRLTLALDGAAPYRVVSDPERGLTIELEQTRADEKLPLEPQLELDETPIARVAQQQRGDTMSVALDFKQPATDNRLFATPADSEDGSKIVIDLYEPPPPPDEAEMRQREQSSRCRDGERMLRLGRIGEAEGLLRECLADRPVDQTARAALAALLINSGRLSEAGPLLDDGLMLDPSAIGLVRLRARLLIDNGKSEEALRLLSEAPLAGPEDSALLAALYQRNGAHQEAVYEYRAALDGDPGRGVWWLGLAISLEGLGETTAAAEAYQRALLDRGLPPAARDHAAARLQAAGSAQ
jgi:tetratricopeptide (TPR) repeat protein